MANKENKITDFLKRSPDNTEINLASRLLAKMVEEQEKKIKEIPITNSISNPARFSQTIKPKHQKITSVLTTVKQQVMNEEIRTNKDAQRRSPNERDLQINKESNLPIFMEKEQIREGRPSPYNQTFKSSGSPKEVDENFKTSQGLFSTIETHLQSKINERNTKTRSTPPKLRETHKTVNTDLNQNLKTEASVIDFNKTSQTQQRTRYTDTIGSTEENLTISVLPNSNKMSDFVFKNTLKSEEIRIDENDSQNKEIEKIEFSTPNVRGGKVDFSNFLAGKFQQMRYNEKKEVLDDKNMIVEEEQIFGERRSDSYGISSEEDNTHRIVLPSWKIDPGITYKKKYKNKQLTLKANRIIRSLKAVHRKGTKKKPEPLLTERVIDMYYNRSKLLLKYEKGFSILKEIMLKKRLEEFMNGLDLHSLEKSFIKQWVQMMMVKLKLEYLKTLRKKHIESIIIRASSKIQLRAIDLFYRWKRASDQINLSKSVNRIIRYWSYKKLRCDIKSQVKHTFLTKKDLNLFDTLFTFGKLPIFNQNQIKYLFKTLSIYRKKDADLKLLNLKKWNETAKALKRLMAIKLITSLLRKNSQMKGKKVLLCGRKLSELLESYFQASPSIVVNKFKEILKRCNPLRNAYRAPFTKTCDHRSTFAMKKVIFIQRYFRGRKFIKAKKFLMLARLVRMMNLLDKFQKRICFVRLNEVIRYFTFNKSLRKFYKSFVNNIHFYRWRNVINSDKDKFEQFIRILKAGFTKKMVKGMSLKSKFVKAFRKCDDKVKTAIDQYYSKWYIIAHKLKYNEAANKLIFNWRVHRIKRITQKLKLPQLAHQLIWFRHLLYHLSKRKFYRKASDLIMKKHKELLKFLLWKFNDWRDQCEFKKEVFVLKSKRPLKEALKKAYTNPFSQLKEHRFALPLMHVIKLQRTIKQFLSLRNFQLFSCDNINLVGEKDFAKKLSIRNVMRNRYFKELDFQHFLLKKYLDLWKINSKLFTPHERNPIKIATLNPTSITKSHVIKPNNAHSKIKGWFYIRNAIRNKRRQKINDWYINFIRRNAFKTLRCIIPRCQSLKIMKQLTDKRLLHTCFLKWKSTSINLKKLYDIYQIIAIKRIQNTFRKKLKKLKFSHKLYIIMNRIHRDVTQKLHRRFILWMKHLHYTKLQKGINLIIELMRKNSHLKDIYLCKRKVAEMAVDNQSVFLKNLIAGMKSASVEGINRSKSNSFLQRVLFKESYRFIRSAKYNASKRNNFYNRFKLLYRNYEKNSLYSRFRLWSNYVKNYKLFQNDLMKLKNFLNPLKVKEAKNFIYSLRIIPGRNLKLRESILRYWTRRVVKSDLSLWDRVAKRISLIEGFAIKTSKVVDLCISQNYFDRLKLVQQQHKAIDSSFKAIQQLTKRVMSNSFPDLVNALHKEMIEKSKFSERKGDLDNYIVNLRKAKFDKSHSSKQGEEVSNFQKARLLGDFLNHAFKEKSKQMAKSSFDNVSRFALQNGINGKAKEKINQFAKKLFLKTIKDQFDNIKKRIGSIDLILTTKAKVGFSVKKFGFGEIFKKSLRLNKSSKQFYDYVRKGFENDYFDKEGNNQSTLFPSPNSSISNNQRNLIINSFCPVNKISFYSPGDNLFIRNIYSHKWWERPTSPEQIGEMESPGRNIYKYLEGYTESSNWKESIEICDSTGDQIIQNIKSFGELGVDQIIETTLINNKQLVLLSELSSDFAIQSCPKIPPSLDNTLQLDIIAKEKLPNLIDSVHTLHIECIKKEFPIRVFENLLIGQGPSESLQLDCLVKFENEIHISEQLTLSGVEKIESNVVQGKREFNKEIDHLEGFSIFIHRDENKSQEIFKTEEFEFMGERKKYENEICLAMCNFEIISESRSSLNPIAPTELEIVSSECIIQVHQIREYTSIPENAETFEIYNVKKEITFIPIITEYIEIIGDKHDTIRSNLEEKDTIHNKEIELIPMISEKVEILVEKKENTIIPSNAEEIEISAKKKELIEYKTELSTNLYILQFSEKRQTLSNEINKEFFFIISTSKPKDLKVVSTEKINFHYRRVIILEEQHDSLSFEGLSRPKKLLNPEKSLFFSYLVDEEKLAKSKKDHERKQKELEKRRWMKAQSIRKEEDLHYVDGQPRVKCHILSCSKCHPETFQLVIQNITSEWIKKNTEDRAAKPDQNQEADIKADNSKEEERVETKLKHSRMSKHFEPKEPEENKEELRQSLNPSEVYQLKMFLKKKEQPKHEHKKIDFISRLGGSKSKLVLDNILHDVEKKTLERPQTELKKEVSSNMELPKSEMKKAESAKVEKPPESKPVEQKINHSKLDAKPVETKQNEAKPATQRNEKKVELKVEDKKPEPKKETAQKYINDYNAQTTREKKVEFNPPSKPNAQTKEKMDYSHLIGSQSILQGLKMFNKKRNTNPNEIGLRHTDTEDLKF